MTIGIVGSEQAKFTHATEAEARRIIRSFLGPDTVVCSGECPLGGVDWFARQEAKRLGLAFRGFPPVTRSWSTGYQPRNIQIAEASDLVVCITVAMLPPHYTGMRFDYCYHCGVNTHVKSGGCWTVKYAKRIGKEGLVITI